MFYVFHSIHRLANISIRNIWPLIKSLSKVVLKKGRQQIIDWLEIWDTCAQRISKCFRQWYYLQKKKKFLKGVKALQKILLGQATRWQLRALLSQVEETRSKLSVNNVAASKAKYVLSKDTSKQNNRASIAIYVKNYITAFTSGSYTVLDSSKITSMDLLHDAEMPLSSTLFDTAGIAHIRKSKPPLKLNTKVESVSSGIFEMTSPPHEQNDRLDDDDQSNASSVVSNKITVLSKLDFQMSKSFVNDDISTPATYESENIPRSRKFQPHTNALIQSRRFEVSNFFMMM